MIIGGERDGLIMGQEAHEGRSVGLGDGSAPGDACLSAQAAPDYRSGQLRCCSFRGALGYWRIATWWRSPTILVPSSRWSSASRA